MTQQLTSPVSLTAVDAPDQPTPTPELEQLYRGFESELLVPLWTEIGDLMPAHPRSRAVPHVWRWQKLLELADRAGQLVPVGRGGERRAIALVCTSWVLVRASVHACVGEVILTRARPQALRSRGCWRFLRSARAPRRVVARTRSLGRS